LGGACYGAVTLANDLVLTSDDKGRVYAFARANGAEVWHYDAPGGINAPLAVLGDTLLVAVGLDNAVLIALSLNASRPPGAEMDMAAAGSGGRTALPTPGPATWSAVYSEIIQRSGCNSGPVCHAGTSAGQLDLSNAADAYRALVGVKALGSGGGGVACRTTNLLRVEHAQAAATPTVARMDHRRRKERLIARSSTTTRRPATA
jgi:outer membrane protein assembly factor BamB